MKADAAELVKALKAAADDPECPFRGVVILALDQEDGSVVVSTRWTERQGPGRGYDWVCPVGAGTVVTEDQARAAVRRMMQALLVMSLVAPAKGGSGGEGQG